MIYLKNLWEGWWKQSTCVCMKVRDGKKAFWQAVYFYLLSLGRCEVRDSLTLAWTCEMKGWERCLYRQNRHTLGYVCVCYVTLLLVKIHAKLFEHKNQDLWTYKNKQLDFIKYNKSLLIKNQRAASPYTWCWQRHLKLAPDLSWGPWRHPSWGAAVLTSLIWDVKNIWSLHIPI